MPEIIEVRKYADFILKNLKNKNIIDIKILNGRYKKHKPFENFYKFKNDLPLKLLDVKTKGKFLYIIFENNYYIFSTLGLNGGWCYFLKNKNKFLFSTNIDDYSKYFSDNKINSYLNQSLKHLNIEFITSEGSLYYFDTLSFGTMKCITDSEELYSKLNKIGPDIMDESTNLELFKEQIKKKKNLDKYIGIVLMNQKIISGIGNYLRADVLYLSKINPFRVIKKLSDEEIETIFNNSKILTWCSYDIKQAIKFKIYNKNVKLPSDYDRLFFVYSQEKDIYGNKVKKIELYEGSQKRFIYYVPEIQI
jgi:formamidopyrimidine-DNA glycosylase